jgi:phosphoenolpyruvate phosphomutase
MNKAKRLRKRFEEKGIIQIAGAHDGLSAKLVERCGFHGVWASGLEISTSYAVPDANILTMTQYLERAIEMNDATAIPVIADCDTGFGNSNNVIHAVKKYESAGISAVCIEDKHFPKVNSFIPGRQELAPIPEFVGKIMAAKNAQQTDEFMVIARLETLIAGWGQEEALKRAHAYADAGADAVLIHSKSETPAEVIEFINRWRRRLPLVVVPTTYYAVTAEELESLGVKMVIYANHGLRASIKAVSEALRIIKDTGTTTAVEPNIASLEEVFELQGMSQMKEAERIYLKTEIEPVKAIIPAAGDHGKELSMRVLLEDIPVTMLDINGKSILERYIETLNRCGIFDINVIVGFKKEKIRVEGVNVDINFVENEDYANTHIMHSLMLMGDAFESKVLIVFSDILVDKGLIERLLRVNTDITLVINKADRLTEFGDSKLDLVATEKMPMEGKRVMYSDRANPVLQIGKTISPERAKYEFIGVAFFSKEGARLFKEHYRKAKAKYRAKPFHEAASFEKASFTDMIQELICNGIPIDTLEVNSGWMEIHTFENYKYACKLLS